MNLVSFKKCDAISINKKILPWTDSQEAWTDSQQNTGQYYTESAIGLKMNRHRPIPEIFS